MEMARATEQEPQPQPAQGPPSASPYVILCDAGSTGTRLYVYSVATDPSGGSPPRVVVDVGPKIRPGLSAQTPASAHPYLLPALHAALSMVPPEHHAATPVHVYGTAGMRLLPEAQQSAIYTALDRGIQDDPTVPFAVRGPNMGTIDGADEGYFAALAVNYLGGRIGSDLVRIGGTAWEGEGEGEGGTGYVPGEDDAERLLGLGLHLGRRRDAPLLLGALDLGGASVQIVFDASALPSGRRRLRMPAGRAGDGGPVSRESFFSLSLLGYGGQRMRESVDAYLERPLLGRRITEQDWGEGGGVDANDGGGGGLSVGNPCYSPGYTVTRPASGVTHVGIGDGRECRKLLDAVMEEMRPNSSPPCAPGDFCVDLIEGGIEPPVLETFYAFTLFSYPLDFARDFVARIREENGGELPSGGSPDDDIPLEGMRTVEAALLMDNPTVHELRAVTDVACRWNYVRAQTLLPDEDQVASRCMELALGSTLLSKFAFPDDGRNVHFTDEIEGSAAEWTLGAYLHLLNHGDGGGGGTKKTTMGAVTDGFDSLYSDAGTIFFVAMVTAALCWQLLFRRLGLVEAARNAATPARLPSRVILRRS